MYTFRYVCWSLLLSASLSGCLSYGPGRISNMSTFDICELQVQQGPNMTAESRRLVQSELQRRKESCAPHGAAIQTRRDENLYDWMYRNQSP